MPFGLASNNDKIDGSSEGYYNLSETVDLTRVEQDTYDKYTLDYFSMKQTKNEVPLVEWVLEAWQKECMIPTSQCSATKSLLESYLYDCAEIYDVAPWGESVLIDYFTSDGLRVIMCYDNEGMSSRTIYDEKTDTAIDTRDNGTLKYTNFRYGTYYEMPEEKSALIDQYILEGDLDAIREIDGIKVTENANGAVIIEDDLQRNVSGFYLSPTSLESNSIAVNGNGSYTLIQNLTGLTNSLTNDFYQYTKMGQYVQNHYCNVLKKNVPITVKETRNTYVRKSYDSSYLVAGTTVSFIAALIAPPVGVVSQLLVMAGLLISGADAIGTAFTLYKSARYSFNAERHGYAYDTTVHRKDVLVASYRGTGEFTGGYNSSGYFTWVISQVPSPFSRAYSTIANTTIYNYNADLAVHNGYCNTYFPD